MGGFGRYLLQVLQVFVYQNPEFPFWLRGSGKHITGRQFLILGSAVFFLAPSLTQPSVHFALLMGGVGFP
jgi:hypothetical protein